MDKIYIRDLEVDCVIGVYDYERIKRQHLMLNIEMECNLAPAGRSDRIADTVGYDNICNQVVDMVRASQFQLLEKLAEEVSLICLKDARVKGVRVIVDKPGILRHARSAAVEIYRQQEG